MAKQNKSGAPYPWKAIEVPLIGSDGNAFALIAKVKRLLRRNGVSIDKMEKTIEYFREAESYDDLLVRIGEVVTIT